MNRLATFDLVGATVGEIPLAQGVQEQTGRGSGVLVTVIILVVIWISIRTLAGALGKLLEALAEILSRLIFTAALFAIVSLTLVAQLTGGDAVSHVEPLPSVQIAASIHQPELRSVSVPLGPTQVIVSGPPAMLR
jgi:hypothetical protein